MGVRAVLSDVAFAVAAGVIVVVGRLLESDDKEHWTCPECGARNSYDPTNTSFGNWCQYCDEACRDPTQ